MNQRYLLIASLLIASGASAQLRRDVLQKPQADEGTTSEARPLSGEMRNGGDVIFSEDWANGLAGNNGVGGWTTGGPDGAIWRRSTTGPVGSYTVPTQIIAQPGTPNGFMLFNSDSANCNCTTGVANWPASPTEWDGTLESPLLNLSATPAVMLQWQQRLRWCCQSTSPHQIEVSTDGGATWPTVLEAATGISTNNDPGTETRQVMLTAGIAADPTNVKFRFHHNPTAAAYHWQIDDVKLIELFANDMTMDDGVLSQTGNGEEYGRIPASQLLPTMLVGGDVTNNGAIDQTNVNVHMDVTGPVPFSTDIAAGTVSPGVQFLAQSDYSLPALTDGLYQATFTVSATDPDQIATNNTYLRNFEVNTDIYSADGIGNHPTGMETLASLGTTSFTGAADGLVLLNYYEVHAPLTVYGIQVGLTSNSVAGSYFTVALRDTLPVLATTADMTTVIAETDIHDVTAADIAAGDVFVPFTTPVTLQPNGYFASATLFSNAGASDLRVVDDLTVPQPGLMSAIFIPNDAVYSNGNAMAIRLVMDPNVGIAANKELQGVTLFPNPTNGIVNVNMSKPGAYTVEVMDALGQRVVNTRTNGSTKLDLSGRSAGVYMVRISSEGASTVQRITLN